MKLKTAKEARQMSDLVTNRMLEFDLDIIADKINDATKNGDTLISVQTIDSRIVDILVENGYNVEYRDHHNESVYIISW